MTQLGLYVHLEAKPGKEEDVAKFLKSALPTVQRESDTLAWFALRMSPSTFGIFDAFPNEQGRQAHLSGQVASTLMAKASDLLAKPPRIEKIDVLADKLPDSGHSDSEAGRTSSRPSEGQEAQIPMQVGSELRIRNTGEIVVGNPEIELAEARSAADAVLAYTFRKGTNEHVLRLLEPVANRQHQKVHRIDD